MKLIILGAGGHGATVADLAKQTNKYDEVIMLDDSMQSSYGLKVFGKCEDYTKYKNEDVEIYPAFGNNEARLNWENKLQSEGFKLATIISDRAYVSPTAKIAEGCVVMPLAVVNTNVVIEKACIVNVSTIVDHGTIIKEGCHIAPGAVVKAENRIPSKMIINSEQIIDVRQFPLK